MVYQRYDYQYGQVNQSTGAVDALKNNGQLGRTDAFIGGTPQSPTKQWEERFSYDSLSRLDVASEYRGDNSSLSWQADYDYDRYGNRTRITGIGYLAKAGSPGSAGIAGSPAGQPRWGAMLPAISVQRERTQSEPGAVATGSSVAIAQPSDPKVPLLTEQLTARSDLELPATLRTAAPRASSKSHHASRSAAPNTATAQGSPPVFTDPDLLAAGGVVIKALHITELRTAINDLRARLGQAAYSWQTSLSGFIQADPILEMRAALDQALGQPSLAYSAGLAPGQPILAVHIKELRDRVIASWNMSIANLSYDSATNRITTAGITYDAAGQTLTDANFRGLQYQYNPEGRMTWSANLDGSNPSTSVYDGLGQRVQTTQAGVTRTFFYDIKGSVVAEYEATGGTGYGVLKRLNIYGGGRLLAVDEVQPNGTKVTSYRMADRQGSTRVLMDAAGAVISRHDYLPYGEELGAGTSAPGSPTGMRTAAQGYSVADA
ncbi:MAG: hypothetical protein ACR2HX_24085 [Pyrinomonadaceae bacterium]